MKPMLASLRLTLSGPRGRTLRSGLLASSGLLAVFLVLQIASGLTSLGGSQSVLGATPSIGDYPLVYVSESAPFKDIVGYFGSSPSRNAPKKFVGGGHVPTRVEVSHPPGGAASGDPALRIIVLTMDRDASLERLLKSLVSSEYGGDRVDLDIWVDRAANARAGFSSVQEKMVAVARGFAWPHGARSIHTRQENAGLYEQWIYTWNVSEETTEAAVILEDDLEVSPLFYTWLKEARSKYASDPSVAAFTLQRGELRPRQIRGVASGKLQVDESKDPVFKYRLLGTWGFAPEKRAWLEFRAWYEESRQMGARPYVSNLMTTDWYKDQEKGQDVAKTMWSQWFIKFSDVNDYFTVYANLPGRTTLASNYREGGLHYSDKPRSADFPVYRGAPSGFLFPESPSYLDWDGQELKHADASIKFRRAPQ